MQSKQTVNPLVISGEEAYVALHNATIIELGDKVVATAFKTMESIMLNVESKPPAFLAIGNGLNYKDLWIFTSANYEDLFGRGSLNYFMACESTYIKDAGPTNDLVNATTLLNFEDVFNGILKYGKIFFNNDKGSFEPNLNALPTRVKYILAFEFLLHHARKTDWSKVKYVE